MPAKRKTKPKAEPKPTTEEKPKGGRPEGAKTQPRPEAVAVPTRCPVCGSTERKPYTQTRVQEWAGTDPDGHPYTHIVRRWTACAACGQARIDRVYENRPDKKNR